MVCLMCCLALLGHPLEKCLNWAIGSIPCKGCPRSGCPLRGSWKLWRVHLSQRTSAPEVGARFGDHGNEEKVENLSKADGPEVGARFGDHGNAQGEAGAGTQDNFPKWVPASGIMETRTWSKCGCWKPPRSGCPLRGSWKPRLQAWRCRRQRPEVGARFGDHGNGEAWYGDLKFVTDLKWVPVLRGSWKHEQVACRGALEQP